jgi:hypothetical protein
MSPQRDFERCFEVESLGFFDYVLGRRGIARDGTLGLKYSIRGSRHFRSRLGPAAVSHATSRPALARAFIGAGVDSRRASGFWCKLMILSVVFIQHGSGGRICISHSFDFIDIPLR